MTKLFKNQDPYESVAEASFTNMMISRVFLAAEIFYSLSIIWAHQFELQSKAYVDALQSPDYQAAETATDADSDSTQDSNKETMVTVSIVLAYVNLVLVAVQSFAIVNQRRYLTNFIAAILSVIITGVLIFIYPQTPMQEAQIYTLCVVALL